MKIGKSSVEDFKTGVTIAAFQQSGRLENKILNLVDKFCNKYSHTLR